MHQGIVIASSMVCDSNKGTVKVVTEHIDAIFSTFLKPITTGCRLPMLPVKTKKNIFQASFRIQNAREYPGTPPIGKIICVQNGRVKVLCGIFFLQKKFVLKILKTLWEPFGTCLLWEFWQATPKRLRRYFSYPKKHL